MMSRYQTERGAALVTVLLFMVIVLILIASVLAVTGNEIRISGLHRDSVRALELAQAGIHEGIRRIQSGRAFFNTGQGTDDTDCDHGFQPSILLDSNEALRVGVCPTLPESGSDFAIYEVRADARVGVAVRKLSVVVAVLVNNVPPEIVLSRGFEQEGNASVEKGDVFTETWTIYHNPPDLPQRSFAGWFIQDNSASGYPKCYLWPCTSGLNLYPGTRRMLNEDEWNADITCSGNVPAGAIRADNPYQTVETGTTPCTGNDTDAEMITYVLDSVISPDQTGGADFTNQLVTSGATSGTLTFSVAGGGGTESSYGYTNFTIPGDGGRAGSIAVVVKINSGHASVKLSVKATRVNAAGAAVYGPGAQTSPSVQQNADAGTKIFALYNADLGTWLPGDRLRIEYAFRNTGVPPRNITLELGTANSVVMAPYGAAQDPLPYKYVFGGNFDTVDGDDCTTPGVGPCKAFYFKTLVFEDWFDQYYDFVQDCNGKGPGNCKTEVFERNPQFAAIPTFPSDDYLESLINQAGGNATTGGGTITGASSLQFGCPPSGSPDPHTNWCGESKGDYQVAALLNGDYSIQSNINGYGTIVVTDLNDGRADLRIGGTFFYLGTIFVKGEVTLGAGTITITGGLITKRLTDLSGTATINTGEDTGNVAASNDVTVTVGAMWER